MNKMLMDNHFGYFQILLYSLSSVQCQLHRSHPEQTKKCYYANYFSDIVLVSFSVCDCFIFMYACLLSADNTSKAIKDNMKALASVDYELKAVVKCQMGRVLVTQYWYYIRIACVLNYCTLYTEPVQGMNQLLLNCWIQSSRRLPLKYYRL